jgi:RNA recognition motif-containing protein
MEIANPNNPAVATLSRLSSVYVGNLAFDVTEEEVMEFFFTAGTVVQVRLVHAKGFGYVQFSEPLGAAMAVQSLNGVELRQRYDSLRATSIDSHG